MEKYDAKVFKNDEGSYRVKIFGYWSLPHKQKRMCPHQM